MKLDVYLLDRHCGVLTIEDERFEFDYHPAYLSADGPVLSVSMPPTSEHFGDASAFPFFENLLPEGAIRDLLAERLGTSSNNLARLLGDNLAKFPENETVLREMMRSEPSKRIRQNIAEALTTHQSRP